MKWLIVVLVAWLPSVVLAAVQNILYDKSQIICASRQMGVPVEAEFKQFTAHVDFDKTTPETSKIEIEIDTNSFEFDPEIDDEVRDRLWLNAHDFPIARFTSTSVRALGDGSYEVHGTLTIKGTSAVVAAPFTYHATAGGGVFEGAFKISRLQYNVGDGRWRDTTSVADEVQIKFKIVASGVAKKK